MLQRQYGYLWSDVTSNKPFNFIPHLLITVSTVCALVASIYSYVVNLYVVPGIQPDSFLVSMDFGILGSFIVSILVSLIIIWYVPLGLQMLLLRLRGRGWAVTTVPLSLLIFTIIQLVYASINMMIRIPYNYSFHVFVAFFFGGLGLSYVYRGLIIKRYVRFERSKILSGTIISGAVNLVFWFYLLMFVLFPNYLFELGIGSLL
jgi:hypothetical protein